MGDPFSASIIASLVIGTLFSVAAALLAPKPKQEVQKFGPNSTTTRGSVVPLVLGCRRVGANIAWVGDRKVVKVSSGGGKGFGSSPSGKQYFESGWHQLCIGPVWGLNKIVQNGKVIYDTEITSSDTPSGSTITMKNGEGTAVIYWGEPNQPVNTSLGAADKVGISSQWPLMCYIEWKRKKLGGSPTWPNLEYEIITKPQFTESGDHWTRFLSESPSYMEAEAGPFDNSGQNPAHALWQVLTGRYPHGVGIDPNLLDTAQFNKMGVIFGDEHVPTNSVAEGGRSAGDFVASMMQDFGFMLTQIKGQISPVVIRNTDVYGDPVIVDDRCLSSGTVVERSQNYDDVTPDRLVFIFKSRMNNFRDYDVQVDDDAIRTQRNSSAFKQITLENVIDDTTANRVARRKMLEVFTNPEIYTIRVLRGARRLYPGQAFILNGVGAVRVSTMQWDEERPEATMEAVLDQYAVAFGDYTPSDAGYDGNISPDVAIPDIAVYALELPWGTVSSKISIGVIRLRDNDTIVAADVYASLDISGPYTRVGAQNEWGEGGTLTTTFLSTSPLLATGPIFDEANTDTADVLDLTSDPGWELGRQIVACEDEIGYLEHLSAVTDTTWQLYNIRRAKEGTAAATHAVGEYVFIQDRSRITALISDLFTPGMTIYVKTVPATDSDTLDITTVTPVTVTLAGSKAPFIPADFEVNGGDEFAMGADLVFTWTHTVQNGAGAVEGYFRVRIWDVMGGTLAATRNTAGDEDTIGMANADLVIAFGSEPASFYAELTCVSPDGGTESSPPVALSVTRV